MRRRLAIGLLVGWLLGVGTTTVLRPLIYEEQSLVMPLDFWKMREETSNWGWVVTSNPTTIHKDVTVIRLERSRIRLP